MSSARFIVGDVFDTLATLPDASVDLVLTSPPFLALRSYLPADHPDKAKEIGSEPTPGAFIDTLLDLTEEWDRVLAPHGSICIELGDTYSGSGGAGGDYNADGLRDGQEKFDGSAARLRARNDGGQYGYWPQGGTKHNQDVRPITGGNGWPEAKSLCLIPELYRISLVYGFNPLTGRQTPRWRARNVVRWCRPNPPVGALGDKVRPATSDMVMACKSKARYFDLDAVRTASDYDRPNLRGHGSRGPGEVVTGQRKNASDHTVNPAGAPPLDHWWHDDTFDQDAWLISTEPYKGSHYATWPTELLTRPIESMCPRQVCLTCGKPSERIVERSERYAAAREAIGDFNQRDRARGEGVSGSRSVLSAAAGADMTCAENITVGWTDCGHDNWRNGVVLEPFAGSGTTLAVATGHGRDAIGIDIDARNADLASERVGMFLTVQHLTELAAS